MGSNPFATLSALERGVYRTALAAHVVEAVYRSHQQGGMLTLDSIVQTVRAVRPDAPGVEIHRAVAHVEYAGLIAAVPDGRWQHVEQPPRLPRPMAVCATPECLRPAGHNHRHLPDLTGERFAVQLVVPTDDFVAAWSPGSPSVHVYANVNQWTRGEAPVHVLPVPHTTRFTPDNLIDLVTAWASLDTYATPATGPAAARRAAGYVFEAAADQGTLVYRHADFCAVWRHRSREIHFYRTVSEWDNAPEKTIDQVPVPEAAPFTGAVLDQICEDWFNEQFEL